MAWRAWPLQGALRPWRSTLVGAALASAATAVRLPLGQLWGRELALVCYFPALILAAALGGGVGGGACLAVAFAALLTFSPPSPQPWAAVGVSLAGAVVVAIGAALASEVRNLRRQELRLADAQAQLQTVVGELAHRNRNALFVVMAIVSQSARAAPSAGAAEEIINARLGALLRAQEVILRSDGATAGLTRLLESALEPFDLARFEIAASPEAQIEGDVAMGLGLLFHELATNALKYGALAAAAGRVRIGWRPDGSAVRLTWREVDGPRVSEPEKTGFGARLLDVALVPQGGKAERRFDPDGLVCELTIPSSAKPRPVALPGSEFVKRASDAA